MSDRGGNLWLGCHRKGLLMVPLRPVDFNNWSFQSQGISLGSCISSVCEGDEGMVWCTVQGVGIYGFNKSGHVAAHPSAPEAVEFIFRDKQKRFWVGTDDGLFAYDPQTGRYQLKVTFDCDRFNDMTSDDKGRIYISTFSRGFCIYDPETGSLRNRNFSERDSVRGWLCNNWIMGMSSDNRGYIWMATSSGVSCYDPRTDSFRSQGWNSQLDGVVCFDVCELHSGNLADGRSLDGCIAIGTEQGLYLYDRHSRRVERFPGGWGVGIREMEVLSEDLLPWFPDRKMRLIVNHHDQVTRLPEDAVPLATSDFCRYEGFRIGRHILTFQGHPEFTVDYEQHLILNHAENEDDAVKQRALETLETMQPQGDVVAEFLMGML